MYDDWGNEIAFADTGIPLMPEWTGQATPEPAALIEADLWLEVPSFDTPATTIPLIEDEFLISAPKGTILTVWANTGVPAEDDEDVVDDVIVDGEPDWWTTYYEEDDGGRGYHDPVQPRTGGGDGGGQAPAQYDACEDRQADTLTKQIGTAISQQTDNDTHEYGAIVWRDENGDLHQTSIIPGDNFRLSGLDGRSPADFGFTSWSQVVALVQSHPTMRDTGTETNPTGIYVPATPESRWDLPSGGDHAYMDFFVREGADPANLSIYISCGGVMREFDYLDNLSQSRSDSDGQGGRGTESGDYAPGTQCP